jgi:peptidyl-Lys metalloendopeptidase
MISPSHGVFHMKRDVTANLHFIPSILIRAALIATMPMSVHASPATQESLTCTLRLPARVAVGQAVPLTFTLRNPHRHGVYVLEWNTPFEGFLGMFVKIDGPAGELDYHGAMVKRGPPDASAYRRLKPGATLRKKINLAEVYKFDTPGTYRVRWTGQLHDVTRAKPPTSMDKFTPMSLACADAVVEVMRSK